MTLLIEGSFSGCNDKLPKSTESPADTVKKISTPALPVNDTPPSVNPKKYTDVHCMLLINYPKISYGEYVYKKYSIIAGKSEFRIEREYRNKEKNARVIPYTKEEKEKYNTIKDSNAKKSEPLKFKLSTLADHNISTKETYTVNDTTYIVYKHIDFNCYDPFCQSKHGHVTHRIGVTYFSPDYGILISKDDENMQFELLASIKEREVPYELIIDIMKQNKMDERIINTYLGKIRTHVKLPE